MERERSSSPSIAACTSMRPPSRRAAPGRPLRTGTAGVRFGAAGRPPGRRTGPRRSSSSSVRGAQGQPRRGRRRRRGAAGGAAAGARAVPARRRRRARRPRPRPERASRRRCGRAAAGGRRRVAAPGGRGGLGLRASALLFGAAALFFFARDASSSARRRSSSSRRRASSAAERTISACRSRSSRWRCASRRRCSSSTRWRVACSAWVSRAAPVRRGGAAGAGTARPRRRALALPRRAAAAPPPPPAAAAARRARPGARARRHDALLHHLDLHGLAAAVAEALAHAARVHRLAELQAAAGRPQAQPALGARVPLVLVTHSPVRSRSVRHAYSCVKDTARGGGSGKPKRTRPDRRARPHSRGVAAAARPAEAGQASGFHGDRVRQPPRRDRDMDRMVPPEHRAERRRRQGRHHRHLAAGRSASPAPRGCRPRPPPATPPCRCAAIRSAASRPQTAWPPRLAKPTRSRMRREQAVLDPRAKVGGHMHGATGRPGEGAALQRAF